MIRIFLLLPLLLAAFAGCAAVLLGQDAYESKVMQARAAIRSGDTAAGLAAARMAIAQDPERWDAYAVAGTALSMQGDRDQAMLMLSKAVARAPQDKRATIERMIDQLPPAKAAEPSPAQSVVSTAPAGAGDIVEKVYTCINFDKRGKDGSNVLIFLRTNSIVSNGTGTFHRPDQDWKAGRSDATVAWLDFGGKIVSKTSQLGARLEDYLERCRAAGKCFDDQIIVIQHGPERIGYDCPTEATVGIYNHLGGFKK